MKYFIGILFLICFVGTLEAAYDHSATDHAYQYDPNTSQSTTGNNTTFNWVTGHNQNGSNSTNRDRYVNFSIKDNGAYDLSCYDWYVEIFRESTTGRPNTWFWTMESMGTINLNRMADPAYDVINPSPGTSTFVQLPDPDYKFLTVSFADFGSNAVDPTMYSFRIILIKKSGGSCGIEEVIYENFYDVGGWSLSNIYEIDLSPVNALEIKVPNIATSMCEGAIAVNVTTTAIIAGATGTTSIALTDGGGANTFLPTYASVAGNVITVAQSCPAGSYTVKATVTDDMGTPADATDDKTADVTFTFAVGAKPDISITATPGAAICKGDAFSLTINDANNVASQYKWDAIGASTDAKLQTHDTYDASNKSVTDFAPTLTMTYLAYARSAAGCEDTVSQTITVNVPPAANLAAVPSTVCSGETITLTATEVAGQGTADSWVWVNPAVSTTANTTTVTPVNTGATAISITYQVKSKKGACESVAYGTTVRVNPKPDMSVTTQPLAVCDGNQVDLSTAVLGGASGLTLSYFSDKNCTTASATSVTVALADSPKSYWVVGKNPTTQCSDTVELKATVKKNPDKPVITGPTEVCSGGSIRLSTSKPNCTYEWYNAGGTKLSSTNQLDVASLTADASYTLKIDSAGCKTTSDVYTVTVNQNPTVTITPVAPVCAGSKVSLVAAVSGGSNTYVWHNWVDNTKLKGSSVKALTADSTNAEAVLGKGNNTYALTVTDSKGCKATGSISIGGAYIAVPNLQATPSSFTETVSSSLILTASGTPASSVAGTTISDYAFSQLTPVAQILGNGPSATHTPANPTAKSSYRVIMTTSMGCIDTAEVTVNYTPAQLAFDASKQKGDTICHEDRSFEQLQLVATPKNGVTPYHYLWSGYPAGITCAGDDTLKITDIDYDNVPAGTYTFILTVTDSDPKGAQSKQAFVKLYINPLPDAKINGKKSDDLAVCVGSVLNLTAEPNGCTYKWTAPAGIASPANQTQSVTTTAADAGTIYEVIVKNSAGCVDTAARKVIINDLPVVTLIADAAGTPVDSVCAGTTVNLTATGGASNAEYAWSGTGVSGNGATKSVVVNTSTIFKVTVTNAATTCSASVSDTVGVYTPETLQLTADTAVCEPTMTAAGGITLTASGLTGSAVYTWNGGTLTNATGATQTVSPAVGATTYTVTGTDVHGCDVTSKQVKVTVDKMPVLTLAKDTLSSCSSVKLYDAMDMAQTDMGANIKYEYSTSPVFAGGGTVFTSGTTVNVAGDYYIRVKNGTCETAPQKVVVNIIAAPVLAVNTPLATCAPGTVDLANAIDQANTTYPLANISYWTNGAATAPVADPSAIAVGGTYYVKAALTGCTPVIEPVVVVINAKPAVTPVDPAICLGDSVDLNTTFTAAASVTYTFFAADWTAVNKTWIKTAGTFNIISENTTTGCKDTADVTVTVNSLPTVTLDPVLEACNNETITLTAHPVPANVTYNWNGATPSTGNQATAVVTASNHIFSLTVTDKTTGCTSDTSNIVDVTVNSIKAAIVAADAMATPINDGGQVAPGTTVTLTGRPADAQNYTFVQTRPAPRKVLQTASADSTVDVTVNANSEFWVITESAKGCLDSAKISIGVTGSALDIVMVKGDTVCVNSIVSAGDRLIAEAQGGKTPYTYEWKDLPVGLVLNYTATPINGQSIAKITGIAGLAAGNYDVIAKVTDANGTQDSVLVRLIVNALPTVTINGDVAGAQLEACQNSADIVLTAGGATNYQWLLAAGTTATGGSYNVTTATATAPAGFEYKVVGTDANGCADTARRTVVINPLPGVTFPAGIPTDLCAAGHVLLTATGNGGTLNSGDSYAYEWFPGNTGKGTYQEAVTTTQNITGVLDAAAGVNEFVIKVSDSKGCFKTDTLSINGHKVSGASITAAPVSPLTMGGTTQLTVAGATCLPGCTYAYSWGPADSIASGQGTASVGTKSLYQKTNFWVAITESGANCVDTVRITIDVQGNQLKTNASSDVLCGIKAGTPVYHILKSNTTGGSGTYNFVWRPLAGARALEASPVPAIDATLNIAGLAVGKYEYEVVVTDQVGGAFINDTARIEIKMAPEIVKLTVKDSCSKDARIVLSGKNITSYSWIPGAGCSLTPVNDTTQIVTAAANNKYTVSVVVNNGVCKDSAGISGTVLDLGLSITLAAKDTCGNAYMLSPDITLKKQGKYWLVYEYTPWGGTPALDSIAVDNSKGELFTIPTANKLGKYKITKFYMDQYPACAVSTGKGDTVRIDGLPDVELDASCLAMHKDSTFKLNVVNLGNYNYLWKVSEGNGSTNTWTPSASKGDGTKTLPLNGTMGNEDIQYILTASGKHLAKCKAADTAVVYRIPDAPLVDIDTNTNRFNIKLSWNTISMADGYTVWSRKWDPYCLTNLYTGDIVYHPENSGTHITQTSWVEPNMDSLKFFYVTADRDVCGTWYNSFPSSDTVGYKVDSLRQNPYSGRTHINAIGWMFDMPAISTSADLFEILSITTVDGIFAYDFDQQAFSIGTTYNAMYPILGGDKYDGVFNMVRNQVYEISVLDPKGTMLVQYGKLGAKLTSDLKFTSLGGTHVNSNVLPFHKSPHAATDGVFEELTIDQIDGIFLWNFIEQAFSIGTTYNAMFPILGGDKYDGVSPIYPGIPMQISTLKALTW